jgi:thiamine-phosphate pyrophosphorylase
MMKAPEMTSRIVDANLNRLAEGLRVVEDLARFGLDDAALAGRLKRLRHEAGLLRREWPDALLARDSAGDVGRERIKEPDRRESVGEVLGAALGRVQEALRVIEELAKLDRPAAARRAKAMRYEAYQLERELVPLFDRRAKLARLYGLYLILSEPAAGYEHLAEIAVRAKVRAIQLRAKELESGPLLALARRLREITRGSDTLLFINDRPDVARLAEADGVHVGQCDLSVADARAIVGDRMLVGKSTHNFLELRVALAERPDYVAIGPVFGTASKEQPDPTLGVEKARRMLARCMAAAPGLPAVAIGGVTAGRLPQLLAAGFGCYALIAEVNRSPRPLAAIRRLQRLDRGQEGRR